METNQKININGWLAKVKSHVTHKLAYYEAGVVVILLVVISSLLLLSHPSNQISISQPTPTPQPRQTLLYFSPPTLVINAQSDSQQKLNLVIETKDNSIYGADLELNYDPNIISNIQIKAGSFIPKAQNLAAQKTKSGNLSYILIVPLKTKAIKGTGVLAQLTFNVDKTKLQQVKSTQISFQPGTSVSGANQQFSVLNLALSEKITYSP